MAAYDINTTYVNEFGHTVSLLFDYTWEGNQDGIKQLVENTADINEPDCFGHSPIYQLARHGARDDIIELAIAKGADIEHVDPEAALTALLSALYSRQYKTARFLVSKGANVNAKCGPQLNGDFPLYIASRQGKYEVVLLLVKNGAEINQTTDELETALHIAVKRQHTDIVNLLLQKGARTDLKNNSQETPLDIARQKGNQEIYVLLKNHSAESLVEPISNLCIDPANELADD